MKVQSITKILRDGFSVDEDKLVGNDLIVLKNGVDEVLRVTVMDDCYDGYTKYFKVKVHSVSGEPIFSAKESRWYSNVVAMNKYYYSGMYGKDGYELFTTTDDCISVDEGTFYRTMNKLFKLGMSVSLSIYDE